MYLKLVKVVLTCSQTRKCFGEQMDILTSFCLETSFILSHFYVCFSYFFFHVHMYRCICICMCIDIHACACACMYTCMQRADIEVGGFSWSFSLSNAAVFHLNSQLGVLASLASQLVLRIPSPPYEHRNYTWAPHLHVTRLWKYRLGSLCFCGKRFPH